MSRQFQVGEWLVEPDLNRISRGETAVTVEPRVLAVLEFLADHPGEVLPRERITRTVWAGTFVSPGTLNYSISELRRVLGDHADNPQYIQTIPRKGYRLIASVGERGGSSRFQPSIAVLAFTDMSPLRDQGYFCDGIAEEIINILTRIPGLRVAARTSSFAFKDRAEDVRTIGTRLGVATVLEGSVRKAASQLRIAAQLINVEDGCHLWSERYDRDLKDVFAIQDEISHNIAATLRVALSPSGRGSSPPTSDMHAYDFYLRGRQYYYQYKSRGIECALKMFSQAIELDATYARAYAGIADCASFLYLYAGSHEAHREQADAASRRAVELEPGSAEAHASRGVALSLQRRNDESGLEFETAARLDPLLFEAYYFHARVAFAQGKLEDAVRLYRRASEVNPHDYQAPLLVAQVYTDLGLPGEAERSRRRGVELAEARLRLNPDDVRALYMGANGLVALGKREQGLDWVRQALSMEPGEPMVLYNVACIQCLAGETDEAMRTLELAVRNGLTQKGWVVHDSNLDPLRRHPGYPALLELLDQSGAVPASHTAS
jgi:adenylate cyclase